MLNAHGGERINKKEKELACKLEDLVHQFDGFVKEFSEFVDDGEKGAHSQHKKFLNETDLAKIKDQYQDVYFAMPLYFAGLNQRKALESISEQLHYWRDYSVIGEVSLVLFNNKKEEEE